MKINEEIVEKFEDPKLRIFNHLSQILPGYK